VAEALELESELRCGVMLAGAGRADVLRLAQRIESGGFDSIFVGDHVAFHVPILESLTLLSFLAAATERVTLGTAVYLLPLRHPTTTAKTSSTLDVLSGGRLVLGVGVGGEFPPEFEASGVPVGERGTRTDEAIEVLRQLWSGEPTLHRGRHFAFGPVALSPTPVQPGGPPIWVGGRRAPAWRRAGRSGDGYISHMASPEMYSDQLSRIRQHAAQSARPSRRFTTAALLFTALADDYEQALDRAASGLERIYRVPFREAAARYCLLGRPEDCLERLRQFAASGVRHFVLSPLGEPQEFVERVSEAILPELGGLL